MKNKIFTRIVSIMLMTAILISDFQVFAATDSANIDVSELQQKDEVNIENEKDDVAEEIEDSLSDTGNIGIEDKILTLDTDSEENGDVSLDIDNVEDTESSLITENKEDNENKDLSEDPLFGRENGCVDENFYGIQIFSDAEDVYIHNEKFADYEIRNVIDVSKYQGTIDWSAVKASGIDYAIIRVGFRGYGESGSLNLDTNFETNIKGALEAGLEVGVYFFSQAITESEAKEEAEYVLEQIKKYEVSLPVVIDFEYASLSEGLTGRLYNSNLSKDEATLICQNFCKTVENNGYHAMIYANKDMLENGLNADELSEKYQIWLANYGTSTSYEGKYDFWQYTQSGIVDGISGNVDKSFWYENINSIYGEIQEGIYSIKTCLSDNKVVDIPGASYVNGKIVQIYTSNGTWAQKYYIRPEGEDAYVIMSVNSGKVLEVNNNDYSSGSGIVQNSYTGKENQLWRFVLNQDGSYAIESMAAGRVWAVTNGNNANGTKIGLYKSKGTLAQKFQIDIVDEQDLTLFKDGYYIVETALAEDKVLKWEENSADIQISNLSASDYEKFKIEYAGNGCYQLLNQKWIIKKVSTDIYSLISAEDGKCLGVADGKTDDGTTVQTYDNDGTKVYQFKLYETELGEEILEEGIYIIHSALNNTRVVDVAKGSVVSDANIQLYTANGTDAQKFIVECLSDGSYSILSYNSGMAMTVQDGKNTNKTNIYQFYPVGGNSQEWKIVPVGKGYYKIISKIGNKAVDIAGGKTANGTNIQIYNSNGTKAQIFRFEKVGDLENEAEEKLIEDGTYTICSALNENKVLDVYGGSLYSGANVQLYSANNSSAQKFVIRKDAETGLYTIVSKKSGMVLTYKNGSLANSVNVYQDGKLGEKGQFWNLKHIIGNYYIIYAQNSGFCLDITGGKTANMTNIQIYKSNGSKAQIFKLKKVSADTATEQNTDYEWVEGLYTVSPSSSSSVVLDVKSASIQNSANIQLYKGNNSAAQKYIVKKQDNGNYTLTVLCSGKLMTVDGTNVCQYEERGANTQEWKLIPAGNGYYTVVSASNGKVLDVYGGNAANGTNIQVYASNYTAAQRFKFTQTTSTAEAEFVSDESKDYKISYSVYAKGNETSADGNYYLMLADNYTNKIYGSPLASVEKNYDVSINVAVADRTKLKEIAMNKLVLAVKQSDGSYKDVNTAVVVSNPEEIANNKADIFKASSKKGIQGVAYASDGSQPVDARYANSKQTLINLDIADVVNPKSDYTNFTYKGKTYRFSNCSNLVANIKSLNAGYKQYVYGNDGTTKVAVSLCLLLSYGSANAYLIDPAARSSGHSYYLLNVREETARETLEALFVYLGELFGQEDCYVTNWILGNEINSSKAWNYSGSLSFDNYMTCYTTAFRMLYNAVKSEKTGNTVSISLDNGWTAAPDTYAGKTTLDSFAKKINAENPNIEWSIAYHPYSYPLTRADFWNDSSNTTNSTSTKYISMQNITVLTNYAASLEKTYKMDTGSIRVLLTEQGYSYSAGTEKQATAIARGYYIAEFNNRIDAFIIRAIVDDAEEAKGQLYFGLMNSQQDKRIAFYVYEYMDSDLSKLKATPASSVVSSKNESKFNSAKNILCNTNWASIVPGFNASKLTAIK